MSKLLDLSTKRESAPAKAWVNRLWASGRIEWTDQPPDGPGEFYGTQAWPSKEIAEQRALEWMDSKQRLIEVFFGVTIKYLGAFPCEGESPP